MSHRKSISPTYDHRQTGDRFVVLTRVNDLEIGSRSTTDLFHFTTVKVSRWDCFKSFLFGGMKVEVSCTGDTDIMEDVLELNSDYMGSYDSSRRQESNDAVEHALHNFALGRDCS